MCSIFSYDIPITVITYYADNTSSTTNIVAEISVPRPSDWRYVVVCQEQPLQYIPPKLKTPLMEIVEVLSDIRFPSPKWIVRVKTRQKTDIFYPQFEKCKEEAIPFEVSRIVFKRLLTDTETDRTVVLNNKSFLIYIQGTSVQLSGSPKIIKSLADIESLLDCVDHLTLGSDEVDIIRFWTRYTKQNKDFTH